MSDAEFSSWIGKTLVRKTEAQAAVDGVVLETTIPQPYRVLLPDSMMTMDFNPERINVHVDDSNKIQKVRRG
jgi:hypothetical protein